MGVLDSWRTWFTERFHRARKEATDKATAKATEAATEAVIRQGPALAKRALSAAGERLADEFVGFAERELARATAERGGSDADSERAGAGGGDRDGDGHGDEDRDRDRGAQPRRETAADREVRAREELARLKAERARRDGGSGTG